MLRIPLIFLFTGFFLICSLIFSCNAKEKYRPGMPYYFESFANYGIPFRPIKEISKDEIGKRESYYVAVFNEEGQIISFSKYLNGNLEFIDNYIYDANGVLDRRELIKSTGEKIIQFFDKGGRIIQSK